MSTSITIRRFLDKQDVRYATIPCQGKTEDILRFGTDDIAPHQIAKAVILKDLRGMVMAVIPGPNNLDVDALNRQLHRNLRPAEPGDYNGVFADCEPDVLPPLGEAYGFETIIDDGLLDKELIYFVSGNHSELIRISGHDFQLLHSNAWYGNTFSHIVAEESEEAPKNHPFVERELQQAKPKVKQTIQKITNLPPMPTMAQKIIQLNTNPYAHAEDLAKLIEKDPSLSAQIIRYAQSPFYGYQGQVASVRQAIARVLGYDMVMNIALGIAATRPFKNAPHGPLGLHAYWRHATYAAALAQELNNAVPRSIRPRPGTSYLCGLLHNFGFLILGYLFPKEFTQLNNSVTDDPDTSLLVHEKQLLGTDHTEIGTWLMEAWNMPQEVIIGVQQHHNPDYQGPHALYAHLIFLGNQLLRRQDIGDADTDDLPAPLLESLGITEAQAISALEKTIQGRDELDSMARQLAA
jgi:HD-like signal output (HDOD) protein/prolyl-tRNA editing enzyme YbaK/EbsC (Cys-tRNA(Pro) deacylase)